MKTTPTGDQAAGSTTGFNPPDHSADTDASTIANVVSAFESGWADEHSQEQPTMRRGLRALFTALVGLGLAAEVIDYVQKLEREIDTAQAAGKATKQMRDELAAINAILQRMWSGDGGV